MMAAGQDDPKDFSVAVFGLLLRFFPDIRKAEPDDVAIALVGLSVAMAGILGAVSIRAGKKVSDRLFDESVAKLRVQIDDILEKATLEAADKPEGLKGKN